MFPFPGNGEMAQFLFSEVFFWLFVMIMLLLLFCFHLFFWFPYFVRYGPGNISLLCLEGHKALGKDRDERTVLGVFCHKQAEGNVGWVGFLVLPWFLAAQWGRLPGGTALCVDRVDLGTRYRKNCSPGSNPMSEGLRSSLTNCEKLVIWKSYLDFSCLLLQL